MASALGRMGDLDGDGSAMTLTRSNRSNFYVRTTDDDYDTSGRSSNIQYEADHYKNKEHSSIWMIVGGLLVLGIGFYVYKAITGRGKHDSSPRILYE